ncbi:hypothetical protein BLNAU_21456 [Blattamonas nauphoetae]|uniref:Uncharacterized protein n=1 Tax=Blattamonas nauphoetae TaxID=2049346 RepID=A0ABQ9WVU3_9EUKA|nr:hypothetical protein BLNAU_21456 [Blattamonas nauphoetae]
MKPKWSAAGGTNSLRVIFKLTNAKASHFRELACANLQQPNLQLSKENVDMHRVIPMMNKTIMHENVHRELNSSLLMKYPSRPQVLRWFEARMRDIFQEDTVTNLLFTEANLGG